MKNKCKESTRQGRRDRETVQASARGFHVGLTGGDKRVKAGLEWAEARPAVLETAGSQRSTKPNCSSSTLTSGRIVLLHGEDVQAHHLTRATDNPSTSVSPDSSAGATRAWAHRSGGLRARRLTTCRRSTPTWRKGGDLEANSRATWDVSPVHVCVAVACRDCTAEPQQRRRSSDQPAGRRARAGWQARREAWALRRREQGSAGGGKGESALVGRGDST